MAKTWSQLAPRTRARYERAGVTARRYNAWLELTPDKRREFKLQGIDRWAYLTGERRKIVAGRRQTTVRQNLMDGRLKSFPDSWFTPGRLVFGFRYNVIVDVEGVRQDGTDVEHVQSLLFRNKPTPQEVVDQALRSTLVQDYDIANVTAVRFLQGHRRA